MTILPCASGSLNVGWSIHGSDPEFMRLQSLIHVRSCCWPIPIVQHQIKILVHNSAAWRSWSPQNCLALPLLWESQRLSRHTSHRVEWSWQQILSKLCSGILTHRDLHHMSKWLVMAHLKISLVPDTTTSWTDVEESYKPLNSVHNSVCPRPGDVGSKGVKVFYPCSPSHHKRRIQHHL